jgi:poly(ribitol-phosphate) beta-N-acetylglucosaminyltransferase
MGLADRFLRRGGDVKMSVVVAVYNTGKYLEPCLDSLLAQSLSPSEFEVILVDDGSDDLVTAARIDKAAAEHSHVTAIHIPNSGWPGRPRNVGIDAARGEYVYFVDHDDSLAPEALERMYAMASRNQADVIIGKIAGHGRRVPTTLFRRNYESCTVESAPLMESMTPHKGFRRAFLDEYGIRFPEGRRRLEDHVFVVEAYLRARVVSVLSDYTCYHHIAREDAGNAGFRPIEPVGYYRNLREGIDIAERLTEPGPRRDIVMRRWYGVEMLRRVSGKVFAAMAPAQRRTMYTEVRALALERFNTPSVWEPLPAAQRVVSQLLRDGRFDDLVRLAELAKSLTLHCEVVRWDWGNGRLRFEALLGTAAEGRPALTGVGGVAMYAAEVAGVPDVARSANQQPSAVLELRLRGTAQRHLLPLDVSRIVDDRSVRTRVAGTVDPGATAGAPLAKGVWDLFVRLRDPDAGADLTRRVGSESGTVSVPPPPPGLVGPKLLPVVPYVTDKENLSIDVGARTRDVISGMQGSATSLNAHTAADGSVTVAVTVPLHLTQTLLDSPLRLLSRLPDGVEVSVPASATPGEQPGTTTLEGGLPPFAAAGHLAVWWTPSERQLLVPSAVVPIPRAAEGSGHHA